MLVPPLEEGCFWYEASQLAPPNVNWCEANLCSIVVEPANTWSNLAFLFIGAAMWWCARKENSQTMKLFAPVAIIVGVTSFIWHASYNFFTQVGDFVAMFLYAGLLMTLNLRRLHILTQKNQLAFYISQTIFLTALVLLMYWLKLPYQALVLFQIVVIFVSEWRLFGLSADKLLPLRLDVVGHNQQIRPNMMPLLVTLVLLLVAVSFSAADVTRNFCDPDNHIIQGHAIWHLLSALALGFTFIYYRQINLDDT